MGLSLDAQALAKKSPEPSPTPSQVAQTSSDRVWVKTPDGSISCEEPKESQSVEAGRRVLEKEGIKVHEGRKQSDGLIRATVCGMPTGKENAYLISRSDLTQAEKLGFRESTGAAGKGSSSGNALPPTMKRHK